MNRNAVGSRCSGDRSKNTKETGTNLSKERRKGKERKDKRARMNKKQSVALKNPANCLFTQRNRHGQHNFFSNKNKKKQKTKRYFTYHNVRVFA